MIFDCLVGLQHGDEGKGKVTFGLSNNYDIVTRFNGGPNAGHTIWIGDEKIVLHQIPVGILRNKICVIAGSCVLDPSKLLEELEYLEKKGYTNVRKNLKLSKNLFIITLDHIREDSKDTKIGTTKCGIGPCYKDKVDRKGFRLKNLVETNTYLGCEIIDPYDFFRTVKGKILMEGAQGFELDIDWGDYPYVTSSSCVLGEAMKIGVNPRKLNKVFGISKIYDTYVGAKTFQNPEDPFLEKIAEIGNEFGSTTGRKRQCDYLNMDRLIRAIHINGVDVVYFNKCDILKEVGVYKFYYNNIMMNCDSFESLETTIRSILISESKVENVFFLESKIM